MSILVEAAAGWIAQGAPSTWPCDHLVESGLRGLFFESLSFQGKPTRVFAWLGLPTGASANSPAPGVVLVHGGGGTAFARWARWWNDRGYAAIVMDTCGATPMPDTGALGSAGWPRHSFSGPPGWGGFAQGEWEPQDQWVYHACAAIVKGHSLLGSLPEVDETRIGVTGVSWGGFLTSLAVGIDPRFRCAAPVYGCGFVSDGSAWTVNGELTKLTDCQRRFWRGNWDPAAVLPRARAPILWLNGTNDFAYWPPAWQQSAAATAGSRQLCMKLRWPHGHIPEAEQTREVESFFNAHLADGAPMLTISAPETNESRIAATYGAERPLRTAALVVTVDQRAWPERQWHTLPASVDSSLRRVSAVLPDETTAAFLSLVSDDWLYTSSDIVFPQGGSGRNQTVR